MDAKKEKNYHYGNLKETLIEQGIAMIHKEGIAKFSLRKLAKTVGVSATACYNHFENADALMQEMLSYIIDKFANSLETAIEKNPYNSVTISMGVAYVEFFAEHRHYFTLLFENESFCINITEDEIQCNSSFKPFDIFAEGAKRGMKELNIDEKEWRDDLLAMWAIVHGLAAMANMEGIQYDGDWGELTASILRRNLVL